MLKIRLQKPGKSVKRRYHFRIVVIEAGRPRDSRFVDDVGYYDPSQKRLKMNLDEYEQWLKKGAQPTQTVQSLYKKYRKQAAAAAQ
ncbi:MAG: 30S ribosomal protein S16 [Candidatus Omnitrophica bacterium]|nr:30S ribosomal protein S16 [Candidatus Omnitrophota bacterium]